MGYCNLHTHTTFSDGKHSMEDNILSAIALNMDTIGFSDHSYTPCDTSYCMDTARYSAYKDRIQQLKEAYAHAIRIYAGLELDYYSHDDTRDFDYIIASVHYIMKDGICYPIDHSAGQQAQCIRDAFGADPLKMAAHYFQMLTEHVQRVRPTLVGHFDVITKFSLMPEQDEEYRAIARDALKQILQHCKYIEVNTGAIARGLRTVPYPAPYLWDTILENGGHAVLSSDSHHKDNLTFYFDEAAALLRNAGFDHICVLGEKGFRQVDI